MVKSRYSVNQPTIGKSVVRDGSDVDSISMLLIILIQVGKWTLKLVVYDWKYDDKWLYQ